MILAYLIFSHLVGDFILQPAKLVRWKMKSPLGTLFHATIHFFTACIILLPFLINGYFWLIYMLFGISFLHFWIDAAKISYNLKHGKKVQPFVIDQLLHLSAILFAYFFIKDIEFMLPQEEFYEYYTNINIIFFLSFLIFIGSVVRVYKYQQIREKNNN